MRRASAACRLVLQSCRHKAPPHTCLTPLLPQILGNNECFEPYTSNIYVRRVLSGEFTVVNQHLLADLTRAGLWTRDLKNELVAANGSVAVRTCFTRSAEKRSSERKGTTNQERTETSPCLARCASRRQLLRWALLRARGR